MILTQQCLSRLLLLPLLITLHRLHCTLSDIVWYLWYSPPCLVTVVTMSDVNTLSRWLWQDQADPCCRGWWLWWVQEPSPWLWKLIVKPMDRFTALDNPPRHSVFTTIYFTCQSNKWILNFASPDPRPASKTFLLCEDNFEFQPRRIDKFSNSLEFEQDP